MKYRAILVDPANLNQERPLEIFGDSLPEILRWTDIMLARALAPDAAVSIYQTVEQQIQIVPKPKPKEHSKAAS